MSILQYSSFQQPTYLINLERQSPAPFLVNLDNVQLQSLNSAGQAPLTPQYIGSINLMAQAHHREPKQPEELFLKHELQNLKTGRNNDYFRSKTYLALPAKTKQEQIWEQILQTSSKSASFPNMLEMGGLFTEKMEPTFSTPGDTMPGEWFNFTTRTKYIHSVGTHGKVVFKSNGQHKYSGIFKGANHGIVRFSSAAEPTTDGSQPLAPGMGLKFLRDGKDSANLVAMFSVEGQPGDWNFFSHDFTTQIGEAKSSKLQLLAAKFAMATEFIQSIGLSDMAKYDEQGKTEAKVEFPSMLTFEPHPAVAHLFPSKLTGKDAMAYVSQLESVPQNTLLYNVYAKDGPSSDGKGVLIGSLQLDGGLTKSKWGDENLFFRHQKYDEDLKIHPQWKKGTPTWKCPFFSNLV